MPYKSDKGFILASGSPRRRVLLKRIIDNFEVIPADVDETIENGSDPMNAVMQLAARKGRCVAQSNKDDVVIAADTIVVCDGVILGKPSDEDDAARMLSMLSGREHTVITGVYIGCDSVEHIFAQCTSVVFKRLGRFRIKRYIKTGEPMDKAGSYGYQGKGGRLVKTISGDADNVIGLPVAGLEKRLLQLGLIHSDRDGKENN
ncbi:MAG: septum formation protein Maf [Clostridia bacterium]|nr:septum formation protein Maf [Clostridia bacterium]